jgi:hypothetical protein
LQQVVVLALGEARRKASEVSQQSPPLPYNPRALKDRLSDPDIASLSSGQCTGTPGRHTSHTHSIQNRAQHVPPNCPQTATL